MRSPYLTNLMLSQQQMKSASPPLRRVPPFPAQTFFRRSRPCIGSLQRRPRCRAPIWRNTPLPRNPKSCGPRHGGDRSTRRNKAMRHSTRAFTASLALFLLIADPALAQSIDLSPIQSLLQGIVDALTGPLGVVIATLAVLGVFLSWFSTSSICAKHSGSSSASPVWPLPPP